MSHSDELWMRHAIELARRAEEQGEMIEQVGAELRNMMPFLVPKTPPA